MSRGSSARCTCARGHALRCPAHAVEARALLGRVNAHFGWPPPRPGDAVRHPATVYAHAQAVLDVCRGRAPQLGCDHLTAGPPVADPNPPTSEEEP